MTRNRCHVQQSSTHQYWESTSVSSVQQQWANDEYLQMEHKQIEKYITNKMCVKTAINARLQKLNSRLTRLKNNRFIQLLFLVNIDVS